MKLKLKSQKNNIGLVWNKVGQIVVTRCTSKPLLDASIFRSGADKMVPIAAVVFSNDYK